jgi:hypothetical protein
VIHDEAWTDDQFTPRLEYDTHVVKFIRFLPEDERLNRKEDLIEVYTDPGGMRVLSVRSVKRIR